MRCCDQAHLNRLGSRLKTGLEDLFAKTGYYGAGRCDGVGVQYSH